MWCAASRTGSTRDRPPAARPWPSPAASCPGCPGSSGALLSPAAKPQPPDFGARQECSVTPSAAFLCTVSTRRIDRNHLCWLESFLAQESLTSRPQLWPPLEGTLRLVQPHLWRQSLQCGDGFLSVLQPGSAQVHGFPVGLLQHHGEVDFRSISQNKKEKYFWGAELVGVTLSAVAIESAAREP